VRAGDHCVLGVRRDAITMKALLALQHPLPERLEVDVESLRLRQHLAFLFLDVVANALGEIKSTPVAVTRARGTPPFSTTSAAPTGRRTGGIRNGGCDEGRSVNSGDVRPEQLVGYRWRTHRQQLLSRCIAREFVEANARPFG
jgi:hypothetical protein